MSDPEEYACKSPEIYCSKSLIENYGRESENISLIGKTSEEFIEELRGVRRRNLAKLLKSWK